VVRSGRLVRVYSTDKMSKSTSWVDASGEEVVYFSASGVLPERKEYVFFLYYP
jgi:hypothetical protein